jgi:hypothetical protein
VDGGSLRLAGRQLLELGLVCRAWSRVAHQDAQWAALTSPLLPLLSDLCTSASSAPTCRRSASAGGAAAGAHARLVTYGRCLADRRAWGASDWTTGLSMGLEITDTLDGQVLLCASGPLAADFCLQSGDTELWVGDGGEGSRCPHTAVHAPLFSRGGSPDPLTYFNARCVCRLPPHLCRAHGCPWPSA